MILPPFVIPASALACQYDEADGDVESKGVFLQTGKEVHAEDGSGAGHEGHPEAGDLHVQRHPDDLVPGLVLFVNKV